MNSTTGRGASSGQTTSPNPQGPSTTAGQSTIPPGRSCLGLLAFSFLWLGLALMIPMLCYWAISVQYMRLDTKLDPNQWSMPPVAARLLTPKYISANESNSLNFTVTNTSDDVVEARLTLSGTVEYDPSGLVFSDTLDSLLPFSGPIKVKLPWEPEHFLKRGMALAGLSLRGRMPGVPDHEIAQLPIYICPLPSAQWAADNLLTFYAGSWLAIVSTLIILIYNVKQTQN